MSTDFSHNNSAISTTGGFRPNKKNMPLDIRTVVNTKADIASIPMPFIGMEITVLQDETNENKMTVYKVKSLNESNIIDISTGIEETTVPKNISDLNNDVKFVKESELDSKIDLSGYATKEELNNKANKTDIPTKNSQLTNDSNYLKSTDTINASSLNGKKFSEPMTKEEYDAITEKDLDTIYLVDEDYAINGVPNYSSNEAGKILAVNAKGNALAWIDKPTGGSSESVKEIYVGSIGDSIPDSVEVVFDLKEVDGELYIDGNESTYQIKTDNNLKTKNKTIVGAINELKQSIDDSNYNSGSSTVYDTEVSLPYTASNGSTDIKLVFSTGVAQLRDINEIGGVELSDWTDTTYSSYKDHKIEVLTKDNKTCIKAVYNSEGGYTTGYHTLASINTSGSTFDSTHKYFFYVEIFVESVLGTNSKIITNLSTYTTDKPSLSTNNISSWQILSGIGSPASYITSAVNLRIQNDGVMYIAHPAFVDLTANELETKSFDELKTMAVNGEFNASANASSFSATITNGSETINIDPFTNGTQTKYVTVTSGSTLSISKYSDYSLANVSAYAKTTGDSTVTLEDYQLIVNTRFKGATVVFEGDSITDSNFSESYNGKSWADYLAIKLAFGNIVNPSLGGSTISNTHVNKSGQIITRITNTNYPSDTKLFFLFAGTNDWNNNVALGTVDSIDSSTILGALNNCIETIQTKLPEATIVVMTPMHRSGMRTASRTAGTLSEVAAAYEKVCERWGVDCINTLKTFGINAYNSAVASMYYIEKEGQLHPLPAGHKRIAVRMAGICSTL